MFTNNNDATLKNFQRHWFEWVGIYRFNNNNNNIIFDSQHFWEAIVKRCVFQMITPCFMNQELCG